METNMLALADLSGLYHDWETELQAKDCPFNLACWSGLLAACLFCASMLEFTKPKL